MSSATVERPAPIARQRHAARSGGKASVTHTSQSVFLINVDVVTCQPASHRIARFVMEIVTDQARRCKPANTQSERLAPPTPLRDPLVSILFQAATSVCAAAAYIAARYTRDYRSVTVS